MGETVAKTGDDDVGVGYCEGKAALITVGFDDGAIVIEIEGLNDG